MRVNPRALQSGPIRREKLTPSLVARIETVKAALDDVYPQSLDEWLDGFRRDAHPEREVLWWEHFVEAYQQAIRNRELSVSEKREVFAALFKAALGAGS